MKNFTLNENVVLHIDKNNKYKNVSVFVNFSNVFTKDRKIETILLSNILRKRSLNYPSHEKFTEKLDDLFGAKLLANTNFIGNVFNFTIYSGVLNSKFANYDTLSEQLDFLMDVINNPLINEETLKEAVFIAKAQNLRKNENPNSYAMSQLRKIIGKNTHYEYSGIIDSADFDKIKLVDLLNSYQRILNEDRIDIFVFGDVEEDVIIDYFRKQKFNDRSLNLDPHEEVKIEEDFDLGETKKISQATQIIVYEFNIDDEMKSKYHLLAANSLFGQSPTSLLFQEVREKNSLCYSIYSSIYYYENLLMVITNINDSNSQLSKELIELQRLKIVNGEFEAEQLESSKRVLCDNLRSSYDDMVSTFYFELTSKLLKQERSIEKVIELVNSAGKEDVMEIFSRIKYRGSFLLKPEVSADE